MSDKTWKAVERCIAARLGGKRVGCTGLATADVVNDWLTIEVKSRKALPAWLLDAVNQAAQASDGRLPIVVLHQVGKHHNNDIVAMRLSDFEQWFGGGA